MSSSTPPICSYEGSDYQTSFWDQGLREYEDQVEAVALKRLLPVSGRLLLELGAGAGRNTPRYQNFERVVLLDYARTQLQLAQERLGGDEKFLFVAADIYHLPFAPGVFDSATMIRTLHHMADAPAALRQVHKILQSDSIFILEYANKQNLKAILRYLLHRQVWNPFSLEPVEFTSLNYDFHPRAIRQWLERVNFQLERQLTVSHFRLNLFKRILPTRWLVRMDSWAQLTGNWWQFSPSVFVQARALGQTPPASSLIFRCPACGFYPLVETPTNCPCPSCGRSWPIQDGIYIFKEMD